MKKCRVSHPRSREHPNSRHMSKLRSDTFDEQPDEALGVFSVFSSPIHPEGTYSILRGLIMTR